MSFIRFDASPLRSPWISMEVHGNPRKSVENFDRRSNWLKIAKNQVLRFLPFYPLISAFQALSCLHAQDLDEIYRLVSKILNFTPCGSVFGRFCVLYGFLLFAGAAGHDRQIPTYVVRLNSYYSSAAVARTVAK